MRWKSKNNVLIWKRSKIAVEVAKERELACPFLLVKFILLTNFVD